MEGVWQWGYNEVTVLYIQEEKVMQKIKKTLLTIALVTIMAVLPAGEISTTTTLYAKEQTVYVTRTGKKYHKRKCGNGKYYKSTLSDAKKRGLTACKKCY